LLLSKTVRCIGIFLFDNTQNIQQFINVSITKRAVLSEDRDIHTNEKQKRSRVLHV